MLDGLAGYALIAIAIYTGLNSIARAFRMFARLGLQMRIDANKVRKQAVAPKRGRLKSRKPKK